MRDVAIDDAIKALGKLACRMESSSDSRRYGVNCAWHVLVDLRDGRTVEAAIGRIVQAQAGSGAAEASGDACSSCGGNGLVHAESCTGDCGGMCPQPCPTCNGTGRKGGTDV